MKKIVLTVWVMILAISLNGVIHKLAQYSQPYGTYGLAVYGDYAYITKSNNSGITIFDISNPAEPESLATYNAWTNGYIRIYGNRAYVSGAGSNSTRLQILDLSDPLHPVSLSEIDLHSGQICLQGNYLYMAANYEGLYIVDVSNLSSPNLICQFNMTDYIKDVEVVGDYAYLAAYQGGLQIVNVANPQNPQIVGQCDTPGIAQYLTVQGNTVYLGDSDGGMQLIDISNPSSPVILSSFTTAGSATQMGDKSG